MGSLFQDLIDVLLTESVGKRGEGGGEERMGREGRDEGDRAGRESVMNG